MPIQYKERLFKIAPSNLDIIKNVGSTPSLFDLNQRFRIMDKFEGLMQVLTLSAPSLEEIADQREAKELAMVANDGIADLITKFPKRFPAGVATLPMNDIEAALKELDRAIKDLKLKGIQIYTPINDKPLDSPQFLPIYEKMSEYDLPIWIHPRRAQTYPDYKTESESKYRIFSVFGWPYETTVAMARIVFGGILERYPNLKIITHHCGGMVPYFKERIIGSYERIFDHLKDDLRKDLRRHHIEYFKMFYNDTAINGNTSALMCAYDFFGADHLLFGTDMPFDTEYGERNTRQIINAIEQMTISDIEKEMIFRTNAERILNLSL
jgi:aminocarboxymuconate-semialdehyde decarboxylase